MVHFKTVLVLLTVTLSITSGSEIKKRGIYNYGYNGIHSELNSGIYGFYGHKAFINPIYSRPLNTVHKIGGIQLFRPQAGTPLGGHVTSYSVNYPRIPFHQDHHKHIVPLGHHHIDHKHPLHAPVHAPFFLSQQPIYSQFHSIPSAAARPVVQQIIPNVLEQRPSPVLPLPVKPIVNPSGVFPQATFFLPQRPAVPSTNKPVFSSVFPASFFQNFHPSVHPQFFPVAIPSQSTPTVETTQTTPATAEPQNPTFVSIPLPIPGVNFNSGSKPEQNSWRPMLSGAGFGINSIQTPAISLLPPYTAVKNQNKVQFFNPNQFNYQNSLENQNGISNFFTSNSESQNNNNNNNFNTQTIHAENNGNNFFNPPSSNNQNTGNFEGQQQQQHHFGGDHDLSQGHQHQEQQQPNPQNVQFNNQGQNFNPVNTNLPFNGQAYGVPSNQGRYSGPSSYEVRLGSRTRNF